MYELYPYFTNDGTVGLFSRDDDDIYHSTYGALSESWQKFTLPSKLEQYLYTHESVKILDICYGIGYNSKTALNVFVKNYFESKKKINSNFVYNNSNIEAIDSDNIFIRLKRIFNKNIISKNETSTNFEQVNSHTNAAIDSDNIYSSDISKQGEHAPEKICKSILIDAVDLDKTLISLSPFIKIDPKNNLFFRSKANINFASQSKALQIAKITNKKTNNLKKIFKLRKEVPIIILLKLLENNFNIFNNPILQTILSHKKYAPFLSNYMLRFANFYQNTEYNNDKSKNKLTFLHNIYYKYVSQSYKNAKNLLKNNEISLNFYSNDARTFIKSTCNKYNFIFLDAFTPAKCPTLWTVQFFAEIYSKLDDDGLLLTYSSSAAVRNALLKNGFFIGKIFDSDSNKFVGTVAAKNKDLIEHELDSRDIDLINSKAGICFRDEYLNLDESTIIENRDNEVKQSELISSSKVLKGYKNVELL